MKRKLDANDAPTVEVPTKATADESNTITFESFNLDPRLLQSISKAQYSRPTPIQAQAIPLALQGKDVLAQSKTGSGKTATYVIPILQSLLHRRSTKSSKSSHISALVLVPTRELADQVQKVFTSLSSQSVKDVRSINLTQRASDAVLNALLADTPDVVVSTPGRANQFLSAGKLSLDQVGHLVIDEADLVLSYGYEEDIKALATAVPRAAQAFLMSATLTSDIDALKQTLCRDPVTVRIQAEEEATETMTQYVVKCAEDEKFLLIFVIFKLRLVRGKTIVFVDDVDRSYRLKLYLEQFGIKSCILNSELPVNSRLHVVQEFNKGLYNILIAADDQEVLGGVHKPQKPAPEEDDPNGIQGDLSSDDEAPQPSKPTSKPATRDYGVSRGIDFQNVSCVLNFDLPHTSKSYTHRIGRTARAGKSGMALSFVIPSTQYRKHKPTSIRSAKNDEKVLAKILAKQAKLNCEVKDYNFDMSQVDAFRYRVNDAIRAVTGLAVREARAREIKDELVKSERLRKHFEENPEDLRHLRHDLDSGKTRVQSHLKHVPDYLLPQGARQGKPLDVGFVGLHKKQRKDGKDRKGRKGGGFKKKGVGRRVDPLKSFKKR